MRHTARRCSLPGSLTFAWPRRRPASSTTPTRSTRRCAPTRRGTRSRRGTWLLTRYDDVAAVYRHAAASSDKQREFGPKFGVGTPLLEHHTTSLVFNDPPLHTRVRRLMMGALNQRAIARMEAGVVALVDGLLDAMQAGPQADLIDDFAARDPGGGDRQPARRAARRARPAARLVAGDPVGARAGAVSAGARARQPAVREFLAYLRTLVAERRARARRPRGRRADAADPGRGRRRAAERDASCCTTASSCSTPATRPPPT